MKKEIIPMEKAIEGLFSVKLVDATWSTAARQVIFNNEESRIAFGLWANHPTTTIANVDSVKAIIRKHTSALTVLDNLKIMYKKIFAHNHVDAEVDLDDQKVVDGLTDEQIGWVVGQMDYKELFFEDSRLYHNDDSMDLVLGRWSSDFDNIVALPLTDMVMARDNIAASWNNFLLFIKATTR